MTAFSSRSVEETLGCIGCSRPDDDRLDGSSSRKACCWRGETESDKDENVEAEDSVGEISGDDNGQSLSEDIGHYQAERGRGY